MLALVLVVWGQSHKGGIGSAWSNPFGSAPGHWRLVSREGRLFLQGVVLVIAPTVAPQVAGYQRVVPRDFVVGTGWAGAPEFVAVDDVAIAFARPRSFMAIGMNARSDLQVQQREKTYWSSSWYEVVIEYWLIAALLLLPEWTLAAKWLKGRIARVIATWHGRGKAGPPLDQE